MKPRASCSWAFLQSILAHNGICDTRSVKLDWVEVVQQCKPRADGFNVLGPIVDLTGTRVDCGLLDAMPNSLTATTKQDLLKRGQEPRSATTRNFETFTTKLETPVANSRPRSSSSQLTETSRRLGKAGTHNQSEALHTDFFSHGLEPTCSRRLHSLTSCRLSLLLSVKLEAFSTA